MWRASWEKRSVRSQSWSEWSPGNLPSGLAWRKSACEAVSASSQRYPSSGLSWLQGSAHWAPAWASSASSPPSEGLPDSLRLCRSEWAARGQGLVCVNDMWSQGAVLDSPRVDQWHALCQKLPTWFYYTGHSFLNRSLLGFFAVNILWMTWEKKFVSN